jgi:hypothetical protein
MTRATGQPGFHPGSPVRVIDTPQATHIRYRVCR